MTISSSATYFHSGFTGVIGIASKDITPPDGIYLGNWGASENHNAAGVHRPLMLNCITFQSLTSLRPLIMVTADLGWWKSADDEWFVREGILKAFSLETAELMLCLSHTHAGPGLYRGDAHKPGGEFIEPYLKFVQQAAIESIGHALSNAVNATLTWNYGKCNLARNRDLPEENTERIVVGFNPTQPADDTLLVGRVTDQQGKIISVIVNYACHPTTLAWKNQLISPDYIGSMRELIMSNTNAPVIFLQGASGDLAPSECHIGDTAIADKHGYQLGHAVLSTLNDMLPPDTQIYRSEIVESGAALAVWSRKRYTHSAALATKMVETSYAIKPMPSIAETEKEFNNCTDPALKERLSRKLAMQRTISNLQQLMAPLWVWQLGDSFLFGQPNEAYSDYQQQLRLALSDHAVAVMNIVNGYAGYLAPEGLYNKDMYAVWQSPFKAGSLELLTQVSLRTAVELINQSKETQQEF